MMVFEGFKTDYMRERKKSSDKLVSALFTELEKRLFKLSGQEVVPRSTLKDWLPIHITMILTLSLLLWSVL